jgi:beta-mannosidase
VSEWLDGCEAGRVVLLAELAGGVNGYVGIIDRTEHYFVPSRALALEEPDISLEPVEGSGGTKFTLTAKKLAKQVWVEAGEGDDGIFSDNFFDLVPGIPYTVEFLGRNREGSGGPHFTAAVPQAGVPKTRSMVDFAVRS